jgi:hypothetical protein
MSDVNIIIDSAPVSIEAADAPVSVNVESAPIEISAEAAPIEINIESAPIEIEVSGARGPAGISDVTTEWFYLIGSWTEEPTLNATTPALHLWINRLFPPHSRAIQPHIRYVL